MVGSCGVLFEEHLEKKKIEKQEGRPLKWRNLIYYICPKCDGDLEEEGNHFVCQCGFDITSMSFNKLREQMS